MNGYLVQAIKLGIGDHKPHNTAIGIGMWLGTIMCVQRLVHHLAEPEESARHRAGDARREEARRRASPMLASRINTMLSIPMLYGMVGAGHFY